MAGVILVNVVNVWHWEWLDIYPVLSLVLDSCVCFFHRIGIGQSIVSILSAVGFEGLWCFCMSVGVMFFSIILHPCHMILFFMRKPVSLFSCEQFTMMCPILPTGGLHIVKYISRHLAHSSILHTKHKKNAICKKLYVPYIFCTQYEVLHVGAFTISATIGY